MRKQGADTIESLLQKNNKDLVELQELLGYNFKDLKKLQQALIHSSFAFEQGGALRKDNETMEFLGDAVLDLTVGNILYGRYPAMREGELTRLRASLVNETHLAVMAEELELGRFLALGKGEDASSGRNKPSILSSTFEAVTGALFLDGGYGEAALFTERQFTSWLAIQKQKMMSADAKSRLQEMTQERFSKAPEYVLEKEEGPDHEKVFTIAVRFMEIVMGHGTARSKKEAEQKAAASAIEGFEEFCNLLPCGKS